MRAIAHVVAALLIASAATAVPTAEEKCQGGMQEAAGKYALCRAKADKKLVATGNGPRHAESIAKCNSKLTAAWYKLQARTAAAGTSCWAMITSSDAQDFVSACTDAIAVAAGGGVLPSCTDDLLSCIDDLATCTNSLSGYTYDLATCNDDLATCDDGLATCQGERAAAQLCGNGAIDGGEDCDLGTLNNASCQSQGFAVGVLSCTDGCVFDTSGCSAMRFADNADGTITDNKTRLMWEKKIGLNGTINHSNLQDADNIYRWSGTCTGDGTRCQPNAASEAACLLGVENSTDGCARCISGTCSVTPGTIWQWLAALNAAAYGGYSDWRMPTLSELQGLIDYADTTPPAINGALHGASCGGACTDATNAVCACTQPTYHWSASTYVSAPSNAWAVSFQEGFAPTQPKASAGGWYVRAVRGGP